MMSDSPIDQMRPPSGAIFSEDRRYRYVLWRRWDRLKQSIVFVGLNPSTADEVKNDPTVRRCIGFARDWGYGGMVMANAFALRSTDPRELKRVEDPVGPENDRWLKWLDDTCSTTVVCWGVGGGLNDRDIDICRYLKQPLAKGVTKDGFPRHPLYMPKNTSWAPYVIRHNWMKG